MFPVGEKPIQSLVSLLARGGRSHHERSIGFCRELSEVWPGPLLLDGLVGLTEVLDEEGEPK
jgi:hypothetical protein